MPYSAPRRRGVYVTCTRQCNHGDLTVESGYVGTAVKQQATTINTARSALTTIVVTEPFFLTTKGEVEVPAIGGATVGQPVAINTTTGAVVLGAPGAGQVKVGRISRLPGKLGMPSAGSSAGVYPTIPAGGTMAVDLDSKDNLP